MSKWRHIRNGYLHESGAKLIYTGGSRGDRWTLEKDGKLRYLRASTDARAKLRADQLIAEIETEKLSDELIRKIEERYGLVPRRGIKYMGVPIENLNDRALRAVAYALVQGCKEKVKIASQPFSQPRLHPVVRQTWVESEAGWGQRPDGFSYHLDYDACKEFKTEYTAGRKAPAPDVYDFPAGEPVIVNVDQEMYDRIKASKNGIRQY